MASATFANQNPINVPFWSETNPTDPKSAVGTSRVCGLHFLPAKSRVSL